MSDLALMPHERLIFAFDKNTFNKGDRRTLAKIIPHVGMIKIGQQAISSGKAHKIIRFVQNEGGLIFYDAKFTDTPDTVRKSIPTIANLGVKLISLFANLDMMEMVEAAVNERASSKIFVAATLTSMSDQVPAHISALENKETVCRLGKKLERINADGIICSALELKYLRQKYPDLPLLSVVPGIRLPNDCSHDQIKRSTPREAIEAGATFIVVGRPISEARHPIKKAKTIVAQIEEAS